MNGRAVDLAFRLAMLGAAFGAGFLFRLLLNSAIGGG